MSLKVEGYYEVIKEPMDVFTMKKKLQQGTYTSLEQFEVCVLATLLIYYVNVHTIEVNWISMHFRGSIYSQKLTHNFAITYSMTFSFFFFFFLISTMRPLLSVYHQHLFKTTPEPWKKYLVIAPKHHGTNNIFFLIKLCNSIHTTANSKKSSSYILITCSQ
ncbi:hypothetical protein AQUCO_03000034v1 [Aquilegia coerulea]|uniref:Bromo domain-containing protein n=1 Tax=Aquilegia coerulea TaxID=218851 RepID=A0A2G5D0Y2_AQUCA|nr:hypothetical protein AQUCO_03000034v1 [Aquilegia coerulea]